MVVNSDASGVPKILNTGGRRRKSNPKC